MKKKAITLLLFISVLCGANQNIRIKLDEFRIMPSACISNQKVFVLYRYFHKVAVYNFSGEKIVEFGRKGQGPGEFYMPFRIMCSGGNIYISDVGNQRIDIFTSEGNFVKFIRIRSIFSSPVFVENTLFYLKILPEKGAQKIVLVRLDNNKEVRVEEFKEKIPLRETVYPPVFPAIVPLKNVLAFVDTLEGLVEIFNKEGEKIREFRIGISPKKMTKEQINELKKEASFFIKHDKKMHRKIRFRKTLPVVERAFSDGKEKIILEEYRTTPSVFYIFNTEGKKLKTLKLGKLLISVSGNYWIFMETEGDSHFLKVVDYKSLN